MSNQNNGGPAFPSLNAEFTGISSDGQERFEIQPSGGMTLRDYFAAKAMQSHLAIIDTYPDERWREGLAMDAYSMADAMLKERDK